MAYAMLTTFIVDLASAKTFAGIPFTKFQQFAWLMEMKFQPSTEPGSAMLLLL